MVGGVKLYLESNPPYLTETLRGLKQNLYAPGDPTDTEPGLPLSVWVSPAEVRVSSGLPRGQGLWVQQTWVWNKPSWRRSPLTPPQSRQNLHRTGKQTLGGHKQNLACTRTQEKRAVTPQDLTQTCPWVSRSLRQRCGSVVTCRRIRVTACGSACLGPFEGGLHYLHHLHHSLVSGQQQGGNTALPINRKLD